MSKAVRTAQEWSKEARRLRAKRKALIAHQEYMTELARFKASRSRLRKLYGAIGKVDTKKLMRELRRMRA